MFTFFFYPKVVNNQINVCECHFLISNQLKGTKIPDSIVNFQPKPLIRTTVQ